MRRWISVGVAVLVLSITAGPAMAGGGHGCGEFTDGAGPVVDVRGNCFSATVTHVAVGDEVTWINHDDWQHNIVTPAFPGIGSIGDEYAVVFDEAGVFPYVCTLHHGMVGAIVVGDVQAAGVGIADPSDGGAPTTMVITGAGLAIGLGLLLRRRRAQG